MSHKLTIIQNEIMMSSQYDYSVINEGDFIECYLNDTEGGNKQKSNLSKQHNEELETPCIKDIKENKIGHRRVHTDGNVSYKNIDTSKIIESMKIGIEQCVGGQADKPDRDLLMMDFMTVESTSFTTNGGVNTSTRNLEFIFKTYAPVAFWHFRDLFGIKPDNFASAFCDAALVELPNPGASGSVFYLTRNDEFITKTIQHKEASFLQKLLPGYYLNLNQNPCTLLPKFFGMYCYKSGSKNVRMIVMNNVLPSSMRIHQKYDLKGSTCNRKASISETQKMSPTFKDLDFLSHHPEGIYLDTDVYNALAKTIKRDCMVLESFQIMDYSLLVGVHNIDQAKREELCEHNIEADLAEKDINNVPFGDGQEYTCPKSNVLDNDEVQLGNKDKHREKTAECRFERTPIGLPARQANGEQLLLFIGIIDILQSYRFKKKLEHALKSIIHDGDAVSVHNPGFYAKRFQNFMMHRVFKTMQTPSTKKTIQKFRQIDKKGDA